MISGLRDRAISGYRQLFGDKRLIVEPSLLPFFREGTEEILESLLDMSKKLGN